MGATKNLQNQFARLSHAERLYMHMARANRNRMIYDMIIETLSRRDVTMGLARDHKSGVVFKVKKSGMECIYWK